MESQVSAARYGKDNVRLYKVHRDEATKTHTVTEMTVCVLLEGDIQPSYTKADNSVVVATDTMKNTVYVLAKQNPVTPPELFGSIVASHFPEKYPHIHAANVKIITHRWARMNIDGKPHPHSFLRDGSETRNVEVTYKRGTGITIRSGIQGLLVLKSTGSAFHGFVRDEYTTLGETWDRILSTEVDVTWEWGLFKAMDDVRKLIPNFDAAWEAVRNITLKTFAEDSASVQATMYKMADQILAVVPQVNHVDYSLPNKHYFEISKSTHTLDVYQGLDVAAPILVMMQHSLEDVRCSPNSLYDAEFGMYRADKQHVDLEWFNGLKNTGKDAEVYAPQSSPNGLIKCTVSRPNTSKVLSKL